MRLESPLKDMPLSRSTAADDDGHEPSNYITLPDPEPGGTAAIGDQAVTSKALPLTIVCFGSCPWNGLWQRHQQIMSRMGARGHQVLYVDPTNLIPKLKGDVPREKSIERISKNIIVLRPFFLPLHYRSRIVEKFDAEMTNRLIEKGLHAFGAERPDVIWTYSPYYNFMIGKWDEALLVYDCVDACEGDFCKHSLSDVVKDWLLKREAELISEADIVLAVSKGLLERCKALSSNVHLVSNGSSVLTPNGTTPEDLKAIKHPMVGYVGSISDWIDFDLLAKLAEDRPDYSLVLVGPIDTTNGGTKKFQGLENVHFLGKKEFAQVPDYIASFDVCIIPFTLQILTHMANPIKLFEYASLGKPTVSTPIAGVLDFADLAYVSDGSVVSFVQMIDIALAEDRDELRKLRMEAVKRNDWDSIVTKAEELIEGAARRKSARSSPVQPISAPRSLGSD